MPVSILRERAFQSANVLLNPACSGEYHLGLDTSGVIHNGVGVGEFNTMSKALSLQSCGHEQVYLDISVPSWLLNYYGFIPCLDFKQLPAIPS